MRIAFLLAVCGVSVYLGAMWPVAELVCLPVVTATAFWALSSRVESRRAQDW